MRRRGWKLKETKDMPGPGFVRMNRHECRESDYPLRRRLELRHCGTQPLIKSFKGSHGYYAYISEDDSD